jgi:hypothetical protein
MDQAAKELKTSGSISTFERPECQIEILADKLSREGRRRACGSLSFSPMFVTMPPGSAVRLKGSRYNHLIVSRTRQWPSGT